jgi:hypothetical protein
MKEEDIAATLEQRLNLDGNAVRALIRKCVRKGVKHDQLNRVLTYVILNYRPGSKTDRF